MHRILSRRSGTAMILAACTATWSFAAQAASTGITDPASLMQFDNVQVVNGSAPASLEASTLQSSRLVFVDPTTGQRRAPEPGEVAALKAEPQAKAKSSARTLAKAAPTMRTMTLKNGGKGAVVGLNFARFSVLQHQADGSVHETHARGLDAANRLVDQPMPAAAKGADNDR